MRFRSLFRLPSFGGYLSGFSFGKTLAYAVASDLEHELDRERVIKEQSARTAQRLGMDMVLMKEGIIPCPWAEKAPAKYKPHVSPRQVIEPAQVCTPTWQTYPAAVKANGGLRGSKATRRRR